ncbi:peptidase C39 family protein [Streptomyces sp. XD-27]|uniref:peptidase C39 family protein n=1 Tax=Streptomyces sp. XD-27 TaxID=3062779 RepID=UPI0026F478DC|nr:peptidase C39 family protein [Streptomyces sp. XD-27]WKX73494.1 peptidase C39 family protein [Streptomyces sp. XD-27]
MTGTGSRPTPRRTVIAAALGTATGLTAAGTAAALQAGRTTTTGCVDHHAWSGYGDWCGGTAQGVRVIAGACPGVALSHPAGTAEYTDPHTGTAAAWHYATWTSPVVRPAVPATEAVVSWNARTPAGTWLQIELQATYTDGAASPWYVLGRWASGDGDIRRTSVDGQTDGRSSVWTDTLSVDDPAQGLRIACYQVRLTLYRRPGSGLTPVVWRLGVMASDVPDRFEVPPSVPGLPGGRELVVPCYSQNVHIGQYPEYDNGGEAWCSPTSSQMIIEYWGRGPTAEDLAWVNPDYADPQVCHAARFTYDYQYEGCGNWPFNAAYAATYRELRGVVTRLESLSAAERLIAAGIPLITSQSFVKSELDGAGYGTAGHLMTVIGFTADGDVIANDPASPSDAAVRRVYQRRQFENIWLRTKRYNDTGKVVSGTGGVCYLYFPAWLNRPQKRALASVGVC